MNNDNSLLEWIDRFFDDELSEAELEKFDRRVREDPDFAGMVAREHTIRRAAAHLRSSQADEAYAAYRKKITVQRLLLLLGVAALLFCLWFFFFKQTPPTRQPQNSNWPVEQPEQPAPTPPPGNEQDVQTPAAQPETSKKEKNRKTEKQAAPPPAPMAQADFRPYLHPYDNGRTLKAGNPGEALYSAGNYEAALPQLLQDSLAATTSFEQAELGLYIGTSLLFLEKYPEAVQRLGALAQDRKAIKLRKHVRWYLALAYLANGQPREAKEMLQLLADDATYGEGARQLAQQIKE